MSPWPDETSLLDLVESVLARPAGERPDFLDTVRLVDPGLYAEVMSRVQWEERMRGLLPDPTPPQETDHHAIFAIGEIVLGRFRIMRELGRGGMGVVYEADDTKLSRKVAIKCAPHLYQSRLTPEARTALEVSHPNVCKLYELHTAMTSSGPIDFLTMEFIPGETLNARIDRDGPLRSEEARAVAVQICAGLEQVHGKGVIHGDLKTSNIILADSLPGSPRSAPRAVVMDFGLARFVQVGDSAAAGSARGGTFNYMAPELFRGDRPTVASDVFALGVLFHCMLTGKPVEAGAAPNLPKPWDRIVKRCLEVQPERRFESVEEISAVFHRRRSIAKWLLAAAVVVIAVLGFSIWRTPDNAGPPVRLVILPVTVEGPPVPFSAGLGADIADRLSGVRKHFTVIGPGEAVRDHVDTAEKAKASLKATHILSIVLRNEDTRVSAAAAVIDTGSGQILRELHGDYAPGDQAVLARALLGTVTGIFNLRAGVPRESVSGAAYSQYIQGVALMRRDNQSADEAIPYFRKAIDADPRSALPLAGLAKAQIQKFDNKAGQEWLDRAEANVAKAKSINPDAVPVLLVSGSIHQKHGRYEQAIADYTRASDLDSGNSEAWRLLAEAYERANLFPEAVATYHKAIDAQPDSYWPYLDFGTYYFLRNQFRDAEIQYRRVTELAPAFAAGHMDLGLALMYQGRFDEAEKSLMNSLHLSRTAGNLMNTGAFYYEIERYSEAARLFEESLESGPPSIIGYTDLGDARYHLGLRKAAREAYGYAAALAESALSRDPRQADTRVLLAICSARLDDGRRAEYELTQALALEPENPAVMRDAVLAYEILGRREKSLEILRRAPPSVIEELNRQPDMKDLRKDVRFQDMIPGTQRR
jgi:tetratricopeptide (TPR) repeat protein